MDADEYQRQAMATSAEHDTPDHRLINAALGIVGEGGELARLIAGSLEGDPVAERLLNLAHVVGMAADQVKKARYHGHPANWGLLSSTMTAIRQLTEQCEGAIEHEFLRGAPAPAGVALVRPDADRLRLELGDLAWYTAQAADALGLALSDVLQANLDKLATRYPEGFSSRASLERVEE
jgi:NTP pyrophosphatase (non-canonical NTP hydrolase)